MGYTGTYTKKLFILLSVLYLFLFAKSCIPTHEGRDK